MFLGKQIGTYSLSSLAVYAQLGDSRPRLVAGNGEKGTIK